jgi:2-amino-4-hydroxy-6-hydroxymethyldihydropteridine diphosphokinase
MPESLVAFGGNVGDARTTIQQAIHAFCDRTNVQLLARSADYRTPPWGDEDQPAFVNVCLAAETTLDPRALLEHALAIERQFGRTRESERRWGPRTIDIDLLAYDDVTVNEPDLVLPHPRLLERAFVLVPLAEIRPELSIGGTRIATALAMLDRSGIERLTAESPSQAS